MIQLRDHGGAYGGSGSLMKALVMEGLNIVGIPSPIKYGQGLSNRICKVFDDIAITSDYGDYIRKWIFDKTSKKWINTANYYVYPRSYDGYSAVQPYVTTMSRNNDYVYVVAKFNNNAGTNHFCTLQINLSTNVVKQIGTHNTSYYQVPWVLYADSDFVYYVVSGRIVKAKVSDLTEVYSVSGGITWNYDQGASQYQHYNPSRNEVFNIGNGYQQINTFNGLNLTTLAVSNYTYPNDFRNTGEGGIWVTGDMIWTVGQSPGSSIRYLLRSQLGVGGLNEYYQLTSQLSNPKGFEKGYYFINLLFYDKSTSLLWVRTSNIEGSYSYITEAYLIGLDLTTSPPTIRDSIYMGQARPNNGNLPIMENNMLRNMNDNAALGKNTIWGLPDSNQLSHLVPK